MRSKGVYRFWGTVLGGIAVLVLVPNLVDAPELLVAALTLWTGACIYFAGLDRTPRSYVCENAPNRGSTTNSNHPADFQAKIVAIRGVRISADTDPSLIQERVAGSTG